MCEFKKFKNEKSRTNIDPCMREVIGTLNARDFDTVACCCGHEKYHMTIIFKGKSGGFFELFSGIQIPRFRKFYKRDKEGYYYIPELEATPNDTMFP